MEARNGRPKFTTLPGEADGQQQTPPFSFSGVTARVFPLKVDMPALTRFIDQYLNFAPKTIADFRPVLPYVYLAVLHYGQMAPEKPGLGWVAQNEVTLSIPLAHYRREEVNGRPHRAVFDGWVWVSPYIFVDDDFSLIGGREFYGWPKIPSQIASPEKNTWLIHPRNRSHLLSLKTTGFP